jgi:ferric-dicitrate binding protein FerR (iron transport regulator)
MTGRARPFEELIQEATAYYVRLQGAPKSRRYRQALLNWIAQSDDHAKAMDLVCGLWVASKTLSPPLSAFRPKRSPAPIRPLGYGLAGGFGAIAACLLAVIFTANIQHSYSTASYKTANILMTDGAAIIMGPRTSIRVDESFFKRSIYLNQGVADIRVQHSLRTLHTYLRGLQIDDIGTHFVVANDADHASVTLISGAVAMVDPHTGRQLSRLAPGETIAWASAKEPRKTKPRDIYRSVAWEDHVIEFEDTPLPEAIKQLHDFTGVNVSLKGNALSSLKISGTFSYDNPTVLFKSIKTNYDVDVTRVDPNNYVIKK